MEGLAVASDQFNPGLFKFLKDLKKNNDRAWFEKNKDRYEEQVKFPILSFISDLAPLLAKVSPHFVVDPRPNGGSMFRIYRDVRFSKNKAPYKTAASAQFRHERGKDVHAPGFYLHLEPGQCFLGAGIYQPDTKTLAAIRDRIVEDPKSFKSVLARKSIRENWELSGSSLKRPPRGYDPDHPLIEDLKRKDFILVQSVTEAQVCSAGFAKEFAKQCKNAGPLMKYLTAAVDVPY